MDTISEKPLTVLHLSSENSWRGGEQQMAYLLEELNRKGVRNIAACRRGSAFEEYCRQKGWEYFSLPFRGSIDMTTIMSIQKICRQQQADLLHVHSAKSHGLAVLSHLMGNQTPLLVSRRVDFPIRNNLLTRWKYNHAAVRSIICVSQAIEQIVRSSIAQPEKCLTIHSGIDISRFKEPAGYLRSTYQIPADHWLIGNTSALADHKDYFTFVDTAALLLQSGTPCRFIIMGEGPQKESIQQYISGRGLDKHILMTGFLDNIAEVLPELDIFLMTSATEGLGTSVLDAFACRIPVVATRAGGIPEMVIHRKTGLLSAVKDAEGLYSHLKSIIEDEALSRQLTEQAYQHLLQHFTKEQMASRTLQVYRQIVSEQKQHS